MTKEVNRLGLIKQGLSLIGKSFGFNNRTIEVDHATYRGSNANDVWYFGANGVDRLFSYSSLYDAIKAYESCPPIAAIINKKLNAFLNGKTKIVNSKGSEATSATAKKITALFQKPNKRQSWSDFEAETYTYNQLCGYSVVFIEKEIYQNNIDAKALYNLPPNWLNIKEIKEAYLNQDTTIDFEIELRIGNISRKLFKGEYYIFKDFTVSFSNTYLPESRIKALQMPINNIIGAYESRNVLIHKRGALGIISSDIKDSAGTIAMKPSEKEDIQNEYQRYGTLSNQWHTLISNTPIKYQQMGYPTKDLMLFEEIKESTERICDAFGYPFELMANQQGTTFANRNEAEKGLYQNTIIPESQHWCNQWNAFFGIEFSPETIIKDYSHVAVLQEDKSKLASARLILNQAKKFEYEAGLITLNQWLAALGEDGIGEQGNVRATDVKNSNVPLATIIGVDGVQSLIGVLTASGLSDEARATTLQILFGIQTTDAVAMTQGNTLNDGNNGTNSTTN